MVKISFDLPTKEQKPETASTQKLLLTERAAKRILHIIQKKDEDHLQLRLSVQGGGCSGYSYIFKLTTEQKADDIIIQHESTPDAKVVVDPMSFNYLKGSTIDFEETLEASQFVVNNPNATSSCGCGSSFSL